MSNSHEIVERAAVDLASACRALNQANTLLCLLENAIASGDETFDSLSIAQIGIEITGAAAERADADVKLLKEVIHG